ncbi:MAG TPA: bifunctional diguanylate cyclase/phosphodiesterase [Rhodanobacteraceae bacterium]|nr:bifunctional diguanylate cyclase/phosphodiesterase [Rhodanobacteraceae bacterium]
MNADPRVVLIVASRREDRRALFDALDGQGHGAILCGRDIAHAHNLLAESPPPRLAVLDFCTMPAESAAFCAELHGVPVIGLLGATRAHGDEAAPWDYHHRPPGVVEWLRAPVDVLEARARVEAVLGADPPPDGGGKPLDDDYRCSFDGNADGLLFSEAQGGAILEVNAAFEMASGFGSAQVIGTPLHDLFALDAAQRAFLDTHLKRDGEVRLQCEQWRADGGRRPVEIVTRLLKRGDGLVHFTSVHDARSLRDGRELLDALAQIALPDDSEGAMQRRVARFAAALRFDYAAVAAYAGGERQLQITAASGRLPPAQGALDATAEPAVRMAAGGERVLRLTHAQSSLDAATPGIAGLACCAALPLRDGRQDVLGVLLGAGREPPPFDPELVRHALDIAAAQFSATLELQQVQAQGRAVGLLDALTGLPNRLLFNDRLETTLLEAQRSGETFALLFVDLDRFKNINDSLGHAVGDQVLVAAAQRLRGAVRASDTVARYAGDEFTVILRHIVMREDVLRIADKLVRAMEAPLTLEDGSELRITASVGIGFFPEDAKDGESLVKRADVAMYNAKAMGRNNYQAYVTVPEEQHSQRIELEARLRMAESNDELRVYYQPQIDARSEDIIGMEALVRWEHPTLGMISPAFFIPIAEETGLILPIGEWVLRRACADCARWQKRYRLPLRVGVNLSALQMMQPNLGDLVRSACADSGLEPRSLELEITESISLKSVPNLLEILSGLRELGCGISIDDFGTGQSSLDYIKRLPADRIKIDQSFVRNIGTDPDDEAIVRATLTMAHNLGRRVVAEGVENEQHHDFLREHGCDELQGYLFCRPLPAAGFDSMLGEREKLFAAMGPREAAA